MSYTTEQQQILRAVEKVRQTVHMVYSGQKVPSYLITALHQLDDIQIIIGNHAGDAPRIDQDKR